FPALAHRLQALGGTPAEIPQHRVINLAEALKRAFGDDYVPHPRLENLIRLNDLSEYDWLSLDDLTAAARAGEDARMLRSLLRRRRCIANIFELFVREELKHHGRPSSVCPLRWALAQGPRWELLSEGAMATRGNRWSASSGAREDDGVGER